MSSSQHQDSSRREGDKHSQSSAGSSVLSLATIGGIKLGFGPIPSADEVSERFPRYVEFETSKVIQSDVAVALKLNRPILLEGGTGIGKTEAAAIVAEKTGLRHVSITCRHAEPEYLLGEKSLKEGSVINEPSELVKMLEHGGMCVLEEFNVLPHATRVRLHGLLDALTRDTRREFLLTELSGRVIQIHPDFRLVLTQNEPGRDFPDRELLDPAQHTRLIYKKYEEVLSLQDKLALAKQVQTPFKEHPNWSALMDLFVTAYENLEKRKGELSQGQAQPLSFTFTRDFAKILHHMEVLDSGDLTTTIQSAIDYMLVGEFSNKNKPAVREIFKDVKAANNKRSNPNRVKLTTSLEEVEKVLGSAYLGAETWKMLGVDVAAPALPAKWNKEYFEAACPFFPDRLKKDTHLLVLLPAGVSLAKLHELSQEIKSSQTDAKEVERYSCFRNTDWAKDKKFWIDAPSESRWACVPKEGLPNSFGKVYAEKLKELERYQQEYQVGEAIELYTAAALTRIKNLELILPNTWLMCRDEISSGVLASGGRSLSSGFDVRHAHRRVGDGLSGLGLLASAKS